MELPTIVPFPTQIGITFKNGGGNQLYNGQNVNCCVKIVCLKGVGESINVANDYVYVICENTSFGIIIPLFSIRIHYLQYTHVSLCVIVACQVNYIFQEQHSANGNLQAIPHLYYEIYTMSNDTFR